MESFKWAALWLAAVSLCVAALLTLFPWLMIGSFADIEFKHVDVNKYGEYTLIISSTMTARTSIEEGLYWGRQDAGSKGSGNERLWGWPVRRYSFLRFILDPEDFSRRPLVPRPDRSLIHEGETRRFHLGQRLYIFDFKSADGLRH